MVLAQCGMQRIPLKKSVTSMALQLVAETIRHSYYV